jgi:hypothetical protein
MFGGVARAPAADFDDSFSEEAEMATDSAYDRAAPPPAPARPTAPPSAAKVSPPAQGRARSATGGSVGGGRRYEVAPAEVTDARPYLQRLGLLADDLAAALTAPDPAAALQLPVARLAELVEDARSVGLADLAAQLELAVARCHAALTHRDRAMLIAELVAELRALATGVAPPPSAAPSGRRSFWK